MKKDYVGIAFALGWYFVAFAYLIAKSVMIASVIA